MFRKPILNNLSSSFSAAVRTSTPCSGTEGTKSWADLYYNVSVAVKLFFLLMRGFSFSLQVHDDIDLITFKWQVLLIPLACYFTSEVTVVVPMSAVSSEQLLIISHLLCHMHIPVTESPVSVKSLLFLEFHYQVKIQVPVLVSGKARVCSPCNVMLIKPEILKRPFRIVQPLWDFVWRQ